jgi:hypothetical protein
VLSLGFNRVNTRDSHACVLTVYDAHGGGTQDDAALALLDQVESRANGPHPSAPPVHHQPPEVVKPTPVHDVSLWDPPLVVSRRRYKLNFSGPLYSARAWPLQLVVPPPPDATFGHSSGTSHVARMDGDSYCSCSTRNPPGAHSCAVCGMGDGRVVAPPPQRLKPPVRAPPVRARAAPHARPQPPGQQQLRVNYFQAQAQPQGPPPSHGEAAGGQRSSSAYFNPAIAPPPTVR